jgi:hypothetical protein
MRNPRALGIACGHHGRVPLPGGFRPDGGNRLGERTLRPLTARQGRLRMDLAFAARRRPWRPTGAPERVIPSASDL